MMIHKIILLWLVQCVFCVNVFAQIYYKDESSNVDVTPVAINQKDNVDCENSKLKACKGTSTPSKFSAFGECKSISTNNGMGIFIPARSKKEWRGFMSWAVKNTDIVTMDSCTNPEWLPWGQCSNTCGQGIKERRCNRPPMKDGKIGCKGSATVECFDYTTCHCGKLVHKASFCEGQNKNFTTEPPDVTYVDEGQCDQRTKCQAHCPQGLKVLENVAGCGV